MNDDWDLGKLFYSSENTTSQSQMLLYLNYMIWILIESQITDNGNLYWYQPFKIVCFQDMSYYNFPRYFAEPRVATLVKSLPYSYDIHPKKKWFTRGLTLTVHTYIYIYIWEHRMRVSNIMGIGLCLSSFMHGNMLTNPESSPAKNGRVFKIDWFDVSSSTHTRVCSRYLFVRIGNLGYPLVNSHNYGSSPFSYVNQL